MNKTHHHPPSAAPHDAVAFIGGGNMASALIGGLLQAGMDAQHILVVEPFEAQAQRLREQFGVRVLHAATQVLAQAATVVWAVKPQLFGEAAAPCAPFVGQALQLSVMAGIRSDAVARATGSPRVVRCMPNTPALIGQGMTGLYARPEVNEAEQAFVESLLAPTGTTLWVAREEQLDAVTALSGSGPAYVFYVIEAMAEAGVQLGLDAAQARHMATATVAGAAALARQSSEPVEVLRERVTSKGGTTHAALQVLQARGLKDSFLQAMTAAAVRARELGDAFGQA
jgi:pyrroline-5-carboxylate reductase